MMLPILTAITLLATVLGFPSSTTHSLTGALVGAGVLAVGTKVNVAVVGKAFVLPLLLSPLLAVSTGALICLGFRHARLRLGVAMEMCVSAGVEQHVVPLPQPDGVFAVQSVPPLPPSNAMRVTTASFHGLPVSTMPVSVGSLLGLGPVTGQTKWKPVLGVPASWMVTLPCAALAYWVVRAR